MHMKHIIIIILKMKHMIRLDFIMTIRNGFRCREVWGLPRWYPTIFGNIYCKIRP